MTKIALKFQGKDQPVTINYLNATTDNAALQAQIKMWLHFARVTPTVNIEHWLATSLINIYGGTIIEEPPYNPEAVDIISGT